MEDQFVSCSDTVNRHTTQTCVFLLHFRTARRSKGFLNRRNLAKEDVSDTKFLRSQPTPPDRHLLSQVGDMAYGGEVAPGLV